MSHSNPGILIGVFYCPTLLIVLLNSAVHLTHNVPHMKKEKKEKVNARVTQEAINNVIKVVKELGEPYNYSNVVEQAMLLITPEQIIKNLKNKSCN